MKFEKFLYELSELLKKYSIRTVYSNDGVITFISNSAKCGFSEYRHGENAAIFYNLIVDSLDVNDLLKEKENEK